MPNSLTTCNKSYIYYYYYYLTLVQPKAIQKF